ncbi:MAG: MFS transporter, partial [bacterium]
LLVGISVLSAVGIGLGYITPLVTCIKWFPEHEGLVSGVSVAGFGGGAIFLSSIAEYLYRINFSTLDIFELIGYCYGAVIIFGALFLEYPDDRGQSDDRSIHFKILFTNSLLWLLGFSLFSAATGGLVVIGNLKPLALEASLSNWAAALAISVFAGGNAAGRIIWGWITDKIGWRAIPASLFSISIAIFGLIFLSFYSIVFLIFSFVVGLGFGACFVVYVTYLSRRYGSNKVGSIYPVVFLSFGIAGGVGPVMSGYLLEITGSYSAGLLLASILPGLAAILSWGVLRRL